MIRLTFSKAFAALCAASAFALCLARPAAADVIHINELQPTTTGTQFYPQNETNHSFTPGYFYAPASGTTTFTIDAPDGATLHIFDDAAGTNEIVVPATLKQSGQARPIDDGLTPPIPQEGAVYLSQGWHKCYVEFDLLSVRTGDEAWITIRLECSNGFLHDKVESVSATYDAEPWQQNQDGTYSCAVTATFTLPDGTPAFGDSVAGSVSKVTSDMGGHVMFAMATMDTMADAPSLFRVSQRAAYCPASSPSTPLVGMAGDATTDSEGKYHTTLRWNGTTPPNDGVFVWMQFTNGSRPDLASGGSSVTVQAGAMYSVLGQQGSFPKRVVQDGQGPGGGFVSIFYYHTPGNVGHVTTYQLIVLDQYGSPWGGGYIDETLTNFNPTVYCPTDIRVQAGGQAAKGAPVNTGGTFRDTNRGITKDRAYNGYYGYYTRWYSLDQKFTLHWPYINSPSIQLNTHNLVHYEGYAGRFVY